MSRVPTLRASANKLTRRAAIPVAGLCAGLAGAAIVTGLTPRSYEATSTVMVHTGDDLPLARSIAPTVARIAQSQEVAQNAAARAGLPPGLVVGHIASAAEPGLEIITISARARDGADAAAIANAAADELTGQLTRLHVAGTVTASVDTIDPATVPTAPVSPKTPLNLALGGFVGLLAGLGLMSLRDRADDRLRGVTDIERRLELPALVLLPTLTHRSLSSRVRALYGRRDIAAAVDAAVAGLAVFFSPLSGRRLVVTGVQDDEGTAAVAGLLALGLAGHRHRVTLLEGQSRTPALGRHFPVADRTVTQALTEGPPPHRDGLTVITAGTPKRHAPAESFHSGQICQLIDTHAGRDEVVVATAAPVLAGADLPALADHADGVLLVVHAQQTTGADALRAVLLLQRLEVPFIGLAVIGTTGEKSSPWPTSWRGLPVSRRADRLTQPVGRQRSDAAHQAAAAADATAHIP
jgi:capsular polysaccharide biosynthesis protein